MIYTLSSDAFVKGIFGNKNMNNALNMFGFLISDKERISLGDFAEIISEYYHVNEGNNEKIYNYLKKHSKVIVTVHSQQVKV